MATPRRLNVVTQRTWWSNSGGKSLLSG